MSRRSRLTVEILIRMPLPAGLKPAKALEFVKTALFRERALLKGGCELSSAPLAESRVALEQATFRLTKRETSYL